MTNEHIAIPADLINSVVGGMGHYAVGKSKGYKDLISFVLLPGNLLSEVDSSHKRSPFHPPICVVPSHSSARAVALDLR